MGYAIAGVEKILREVFLPCLFLRKSKYIPPIVGTLCTMLVKKYGLGLQNMVIPANEKSLSLQLASTVLIGTMTGTKIIFNR